MLTLPPSVRIFVCLEATDMRKGFDGLAFFSHLSFKQIGSFEAILFLQINFCLFFNKTTSEEKQENEI